MSALKLKEKLIEQFNLFIEDESKLLALDGIFDAMNTTKETPSIVPDEHYKIVEQHRRDYLVGQTNGATWQEVKQKLKEKYGF